MMQDSMNVPWHMGGSEWLELSLFWTVAITVFIVLLITVTLQPAQGRIRTFTSTWLQWPEVKLVMLGLPLELLWEVAQFPLYDVWHQNDWSYILFGLAHCTLGDLLILLISYEVISLLARNRAWYKTNGILARGLVFTFLGAAYTVYSEIMNVRIKGTWGYTELMPMVPVLDIGGMPFLQWLLVPPVLLWLMRITRL